MQYIFLIAWLGGIVACIVGWFIDERRSARRIKANTDLRVIAMGEYPELRK